MGFNLYRTDDDIKELWNDFSSTVYPLCYSYMQNALSADAALIKVFIDAMKYEKDFIDNSEAEKWLILRTDYICGNMLRHWWCVEDEYFILDDEEYSSINEAVKTTPEMNTITSLPKKYKLVLYLYCHEGLSSQETADYLELSQQTIRNRLHKIRLLTNDNLTDTNSYKSAYDSITLSEDKSDYLLKLVIAKAHDEEFYSNIKVDDEDDEDDKYYANSFHIPEDFDDKAEAIAILKANFPKLIPGAVCLIAIIVISIMYFLKNPM